MKNLIIIIVLCLGWYNIQGQSIYKSWYSKSNYNLCVTLNEQGYLTIDELEYIKFKRKKNQIKIKDYYNHRALIGGKDTYWFTIERLTEDTLLLTQDFKKNQFEHMSGDTITLIAIPGGCTEKWKEEGTCQNSCFSKNKKQPPSQNIQSLYKV